MLGRLFTGAVVLMAWIGGAAAQVPSPPVSPDGESLPQVEGLTAKEVAAIATTIVLASIAAYRQGGPGPCACPNDTDKAGRRCGKRSARDRAGGWTVYCYLTDVPAAMIKAKATSATTTNLK